MAERLAITGLPDGPLDAAADFYRNWLGQARQLGADGTNCLTLTFPATDHTHRTWRKAAIQELARVAAPVRVNGVSGEDRGKIDSTCQFLESAPGVTGHYLICDSVKPPERS